MEENEITFHAVEKDGVVTAIWEMQGRKHLRTIDPRSEEGRRILGTYTMDENEHAAAAEPAAQPEEQSDSAQ
jgi:DNA-binding PadR family transcriptional regulator